MHAHQHHACNFNGLMSLYETNYMLLRSLIPCVVGVDNQTVSSVNGGQDLFLQVIEHNKYTSCISLTHRFREKDAAVALPGLTIRIYFDACQAEVVSWQGRENFAGLNAHSFSRLPSVKAKWQVNLFLGKWLQYCLKIGHRFERSNPRAIGCRALTETY